MRTANYVQMATFIFCLLVMYEQYRMFKEDPTNWKRGLNGASYALSVMIFYGLYFSDYLKIIDIHAVNPLFFSDLSPFIRLYSLVTCYSTLRSSRQISKITNKTKALLSQILSDET